MPLCTVVACDNDAGGPEANSRIVWPGANVVLFGASGAGKSTVLKMLSRLYRPDSGQIIIGGDGTAKNPGVDLNKIKIQGFREQIAIVPQAGGLFSTTVGKNLLAVKPDATMAEIESALRSAEALGFIKRKGGDDLAKGLDAPVESFSGGQQQRIAIARALLRKSNLLLLDEWSQGLDNANESSIAKVFDRMQKGRTTIIIDHSLRYDKKTTKIIVMKDGKVIDAGSHDLLMERNPSYRAAVKLGERNK